MQEVILLKLGEIVLKGNNKRAFEQKLIANVNRRLAPFGDFRVYALQSTIYVEPQGDGIDMTATFDGLKTVFGVASLSRAVPCEKDKDAIANMAIAHLKEDFAQAKSFKVESKRADKRFPLNSIQLSQHVGGALAKAYPSVKVDVRNPDLTVTVEVRDHHAYIHADAHRGAGGMPVGSNGRAVSLLSGGIDSPVATYMIAKRGISIIPVHFHSFPYTSQQATDKVLTLAEKLEPYCGKLWVQVVSFTPIQQEMRKVCPENLFTIIMRRFMMRIAQQIAHQRGAGALVTGESLGQVASQTLEAMGATEQPIDLPVLRPVVGMDKEEIVQIARKIGTFETSILPFEDCCTVFTPKNPRTRPRMDEVLAAEEKLDVDGLVKAALETYIKENAHAKAM